jgi:hypothetical protein
MPDQRTGSNKPRRSNTRPIPIRRHWSTSRSGTLTSNHNRRSEINGWQSAMPTLIWAIHNQSDGQRALFPTTAPRRRQITPPPRWGSLARWPIRAHTPQSWPAWLQNLGQHMTNSSLPSISTVGHHPSQPTPSCIHGVSEYPQRQIRGPWWTDSAKCRCGRY